VIVVGRTGLRGKLEQHTRAKARGRLYFLLISDREVEYRCSRRRPYHPDGIPMGSWTITVRNDYNHDDIISDDKADVR